MKAVAPRSSDHRSRLRPRVHSALTEAFLLCAFVTAAHGAAVFKGKLVRNEINGAPLPGASIRALGAAPTLSLNPGGDFILRFPEKTVGDRVTLSVAMPGMVVVNWVQLDVTLPKDPDLNELTLILAREADRDEMARRFFRLRSVEAIEATYKRLLAEGNQGRAQLQKQLQEAKAAAAKTAEELAKVRPGDASGLYEDAMRHFAAGKIDEALQILNEADLRRLARAAQDRKQQAEKQLAEATSTWLLRARLLTTELQFADAEKAYATAVDIAPSDFDACYAQAYFLQSLNRYLGATSSYESCLALARAQHNEQEMAATLNNLGVLYIDQNRMEDGRKSYDEALAILRKLAAANPDVYLPQVAGTLNNLGVLHRTQNRMEEGREVYEEALATYRKLAASNLDIYLSDIARTLNNLGNLYSNQNRMEEGREVYEEVLTIYRKLAAANPETYLPDVAMTLNNLGLLHYAQNRMGEGREVYEEALITYRKLAASKPDTYLPGVAATLNNLGMLNCDQNQIDEGRKTYAEAFAIYGKLAAANPDAYGPYVARVLWNMGNMQASLNQIAQARRSYSESLSTFRKFAERDPDQYQPLVNAVAAALEKLPQ